MSRLPTNYCIVYVDLRGLTRPGEPKISHTAVQLLKRVGDYNRPRAQGILHLIV